MKRKELSSLLQGLDKMPDGVCYSKDNKPVFLNAAMKKIMDTAFITGTSDSDVFERLYDAGLKDGCRTEKTDDANFLLLPDNSAWNVRVKTISDGEQIYKECIAYDVTELYNKCLELRRRNEHIEAVNEKIKKYSSEMDSMIRGRELLDAKIKIHDDVGRALLSLRSYLYREDGDRDFLVKLWHYTVSVLRRETAPDISDNRFDALIEAARAVDVTLELDGDIPDDTAIRDVSAMAIRECLTNTVKHAEGNNVYIKTSLDDGKYTIRIKNDGKQPDKPVEEIGGLNTLRRAVMRYDGEMTVEWEDGFELIITLNSYKGEQNE